MTAISNFFLFVEWAEKVRKGKKRKREWQLKTANKTAAHSHVPNNGTRQHLLKLNKESKTNLKMKKR